MWTAGGTDENQSNLTRHGTPAEIRTQHLHSTSLMSATSTEQL